MKYLNYKQSARLRRLAAKGLMPSKEDAAKLAKQAIDDGFVITRLPDGPRPGARKPHFGRLFRRDLERLR